MLAAHILYDPTSVRLSHSTSDLEGNARDLRSGGYPGNRSKKKRAKGLTVKSVPVAVEVERSKWYKIHLCSDCTTRLSEPTWNKPTEVGSFEC